MHFSNFFNLNLNGHEDIDFIDINLNTDIKLFIDPCIIENSNDSFSKECSYVINSFFDSIFNCCTSNNDYELYKLLDFGHEPNETKLGLSRHQSSGKGATSKVLYDIFKEVSNKNLIKDGIIANPMDLCVFVDNFAEDRLSDLLTNILRKKLYDFTKLQCKKLNIPLTDKKQVLGCYWDPHLNCWNTLEDYPLKANNLLLLLVPKTFVRPNYFYSVSQYLQHKVLSQRQTYHQVNQTSLAKITYDKHGNVVFKKPSKKSIYTAEIKGHPRKSYAQIYSKKNPDTLKDFRKYMLQKSLLPEAKLSNEELDRIVYKKSVKIS
ncbi:hypothetical protein [Clostridium weizhouense]|uniref:Uncharacterized protein n=1 Tax=Clostridium weizhouense TaxID=2859781 RepID=A0ABS7ASD7_9CLOT|nr:hypothetical protein [Clostridium weizhouense]MBW6411326.1 hypothetical protein [Clostridium weizhouense]